jgi:protein dithiol oxidoreductase (disulfide-forming)
MRFVQIVFGSVLIAATVAGVFAFSRGSSSIEPVTKLAVPAHAKLVEHADVVVFFHYACAYCYEAEVATKSWLTTSGSSRRLMHVPVDYKIGRFDAVQVMYTLESLGALDRLHERIFSDLHDHQINLGDPKEFSKWLLANQIQPALYAQHAESDSVKTKIAEANALQRQLDVSRIPTFLVRGQFIVRPTMERKIAGALSDISSLLH